ncbi:MAG: DNA/RNA non-specific endonuclease [Candidatus Delongbacteria bacterium]|nr:DNA/RNA non-specific endonuclease [Candidatus Delongbacteria bacterium]MBN2834719.1 DNA/RNA non-specific endonuclease [Candidatus Delongbacteria bacterium]
MKKSIGSITLIFFILLSIYYLLFEYKRSEFKLYTKITGKHLLFGDKSLLKNPKILKLEREGYTCYFNTETKSPDLVAYKLKSNWITGKKFYKNRDFKEDNDKNLPLSAVVSPSDYTSSGYDRGHLARQADMRGRSTDCEKEALLMTNIAPQEPNFNRKTWLNLEDVVQKWCIDYDSIWVVCGPWYDEKKEYLKSKNEDIKIEIPDGFYKIIIKYNDDTIESNSFLLKQSDTSIKLDKYSVSIDSIESKIGYDLFPDLDDDDEAKFEASINLVWN